MSSNELLLSHRDTSHLRRFLTFEKLQNPPIAIFFSFFNLFISTVNKFRVIITLKSILDFSLLICAHNIEVLLSKEPLNSIQDKEETLFLPGGEAKFCTRVSSLLKRFWLISFHSISPFSLTIILYITYTYKSNRFFVLRRSNFFQP